VIKIYWTKGFVFSGNILPFSINWRYWGDQVKGLGIVTKLRIIRRFELTELYYDARGTFKNTDKEARRSLNRILSQMTTVNYRIGEITRINIIRLYLIQSFRGKAQALGKPSHGQRTWSNAWTAYLYNKSLRIYITNVQKEINRNKKVERIDYKKLKKKFARSANADKPKEPKKERNLWF